VAGGAFYLHHKLSGTDEDGSDEGSFGSTSYRWITSYERDLKDTRALMRSLQEEFEQTDPLVSAIQIPASGRYVGDSAEDNDGDQAVMTSLTFSKDGRILGWGEDGADGRYWIKEGRWSSTADGTGGARVAWIESYDDGFEVALRGQVRKSDGAILGMWASTRGVSGSVKLNLE